MQVLENRTYKVGQFITLGDIQPLTAKVIEVRSDGLLLTVHPSVSYSNRFFLKFSEI